MMPGVANANRGNPNDYFNNRGIWAAYIVVVGFVHYVFLSLPFLDTPMAWTLTNVTHAAVSTNLSVYQINIGPRYSTDRKFVTPSTHTVCI